MALGHKARQGIWQRHTNMNVHKTKHRFLHMWQTAQEGYNMTSWFFVVLAGGAFFEQYFGLKGLLGTGVATAIFYGIGYFSRKPKKAKT